MAAGGTIDASPYIAGDGSLYLHYADNSGIRGQRLTSDGLALAGDEHMLMTANSGYSWEQPRIEGPSMFTTPNNTIVLLYSAGLYYQTTYSVGAASCDTPLGPCHRIYSTPVLASRGTMLAPGGQTPFQLSDSSWQLAFHSWSTPPAAFAASTSSPSPSPPERQPSADETAYLPALVTPPPIPAAAELPRSN